MGRAPSESQAMGQPSNDGPWFPAYFPNAATYRGWREQPLPRGVREAAIRRKAFPYSERHLHCVWADPELRPHTLKTRGGELVQIEYPGIWNQEAGPDFLGAVLKIGDDQRRISGDVEIHIHPADWRAHGHDRDPRYDRVRFHVTYFPGAGDEIITRPGAVQVVLKDALQAVPGFSFDLVDLAAYPYAGRADMPPCSQVLRAYDFDQRVAVLRAAGEERLRRKAERMALTIAERGAAQTLFEETMAALGYKHNKRAFRQVALSIPLVDLQHESANRPDKAYALLMGISGLLPEQPSPRWDTAIRKWMRGHWDVWWRYRDRFGENSPPPKWRMDGLRPANRPERRLMAAAHLFAAPDDFARRVRPQKQETAEKWTKRVMQSFDDLRDPVLSYRQGFTGKPGKKPIALIGASRAAAILTNVLIPWLVAQSEAPAILYEALNVLPIEPDNGIIKQTAFYLFGRDHSPKLYRTELARQGLLQIFHDFCLNDRSRCATCIFPAALTRHLETGR